MKHIAIITTLLILLMTGCKEKVQHYSSGVSQMLANSRAENISDVHYKLYFNIPESKEENITSNMEVKFNFSKKINDVVLDFKEKKENILSVKIGKKTPEYRFENEHIIISKKYFKKGENTVNISFIAGNTSLNRNKEFLYTLLVPDRARTLFPCFDQPDIKAVYSVKIEVPESWVAIANGKLNKVEEKQGRKVFIFSDTRKLSTYLFAFSAGKFQRIDKEIDGRVISMYHRETNKEKVELNKDIIFEQVGNSIKWLEEYTGIKYPFACYNIVCIPSFQYGGMEHPGCTLYRSSILFQDKTASQSQKLRRAQLLAHETAHMWFGDLVTMKWFDDVWLKEVFANFYADKMVNPMYPEVDHKLGFVMSHYPKAYKVDRSKGANPIIQNLPNLNEAGTVYGRIIYDKSPVVMTMLEEMLGEDKLQQGIREYLKKYSYSNAIWDDLVNILDTHTDIDLKEWSNIWVKEPGMPVITCERIEKDGKKGYLIKQTDPANKERIWKQTLNVYLAHKNGQVEIKICQMDGAECFIESPEVDCIIPNGVKGYGYFKLDDKSFKWLMSYISKIEYPLVRGMALIDIYEALLNNRIKATNYLDFLGRYLKKEKVKHLINRSIADYSKVYWTLLDSKERKKYAPKAEALFMKLMNSTKDKSLKHQYFSKFSSVALTDKSVNLLKKVWEKKKKFKGLYISENDYIGLAYGLALREVKGYEDILKNQRAAIKNPDKLAKYDFILPVMSHDQAVRDEFFNKLSDAKNREHEVWVQNALSYLHHPLREGASVKYLKKTLELLKEIQETGDIFFPMGWLGRSFGTYSSEEAAQVVVEFLKEHPDYYESLRLKILQETDILLRSSGYYSKIN